MSKQVAVRVTEHPQWEAMSEDVISEVRDQHQRTVFGLRNLKVRLCHVQYVCHFVFLCPV